MDKVAEIVQHVRDLAAEKPDFVYTEQPERYEGVYGCSYRTAGPNVIGGEGCIVGQAFKRAGASDTFLATIEGQPATTAMFEFLEEYGDGGDEDYDDKHIGFLANVQEAQDSGCSWGEAVANA